MQTPEQAFRAYYASMTDSDLLAIVKNRKSYIRLAQALLAEELERRQIAPPAIAPPEVDTVSLFAALRRRFCREPAQPLPSCQEAAAPKPQIIREPITDTDSRTRQPRRGAGNVGATEDQVSMVGTLPERTNGRGTKIEDLAGTGQHDSLGG